MSITKDEFVTQANCSLIRFLLPVDRSLRQDAGEIYLVFCIMSALHGSLHMKIVRSHDSTQSTYGVCPVNRSEHMERRALDIRSVGHSAEYLAIVAKQYFEYVRTCGNIIHVSCPKDMYELIAL